MPTFKISEGAGRELDKFKRYMREQEYTDASVTGYCTYLSRFLRQVGLQESGALKETIEVFLETERAEHPRTFKYCRAAMRLYYKMVIGGNLKKKTEAECAPEIAILLQCFREYSQEVKHLEEVTTVSEVSHVRGFLEHMLASNPEGFIDGLKAEDIRRYVVERLSVLSDSTKGRMITSIRNYFRCQAFYGQSVHPSIFRLPLSPAMEKIRFSNNHRRGYFRRAAQDS